MSNGANFLKLLNISGERLFFPQLPKVEPFKELQMKYLLTTMLTAFCSIGSMSAAVVTSTTCTVGTQSILNPTACSIGPLNTNLSANAGITINSLTSVPSQGSIPNFTIDLNETAQATGTDTAASTTTNITDQFLTSGPVRQGVIRGSGFAAWNGSPGYNPGGANVSIGSLTGSCGGNTGFICSGLLNYPGAPFSQSFTLGNPFSLSFSENFLASASFEESSSISGRTVFAFSLFEVDGTTPVAIYAAPEPGTLGLLLACLGGMAAMGGARKLYSRRLSGTP